MRLAVSNIGWAAEQDEAVYLIMKGYGFEGLEIAPTRILPELPYDRLKEADVWAEDIRRRHGFTVSSMQSIWFGRQEKLFGTDEERNILAGYTKKAIDFAAAIGCGNLVFGCPRNRAIPDGADAQTGVSFFREIGDYAARKGTVIGMEANPPIYHTNYVNDTASALRLIEEVGSDGFGLNLDVGTMVQNGEEVDVLRGKVGLISHVHISEPGLKPIETRRLHGELKELLLAEGYQRFVSIEMGKADTLAQLEDAVRYVKEIFG